VWDFYVTYVTRVRLTRILVFECAATVNKLSRTIRQIDECNLNCGTALPSFDDVCRLYSGFTVSPPIEDTRDLIRYVQPTEASLIGFFFDRWARLKDLETRYSEAHRKLIESIARIESAAPDAKQNEMLAKEYLNQATENLRALRRCAIALCHYSCQLFWRMFSAANLGRNFALIRDHSNGRWKTWTDFQKDEEKFKSLHKEVRGY
jgi:hypothetical protein